MRKRLIVLVLIIGLVLLLTSCSFRITFTIPPITPPTTPLEYSSLTVISRNDCARGYVYVNEENTGKWLKPWGYVVISDVPCYQSVSVRLYIPPYHFSHVEYITPVPVEENFVYFYHY